MRRAQPFASPTVAVVGLSRVVFFDACEETMTIAGQAFDFRWFGERWTMRLCESDDVCGHHSLVAGLVMLTQSGQGKIDLDPFRHEFRPCEERRFIDEKPVINYPHGC
jgi:hypothetical protein